MQMWEVTISVILHCRCGGYDWNVTVCATYVTTSRFYLTVKVRMEIEQASMTPPMKLNLAIKNGDLTEFKRLVEEGHVDPRSEAAKDPHLGAAPLYWACEQGHLDIVMYLVE